MLQFVPMTDDVLYRTDDLPGPLVPYRCGLPIWHQLRTPHDAAPAQPTPARAEETVSA